MLNKVKCWENQSIKYMSQYRVSDCVVTKACRVLLVLICGAYNGCIICMAKTMKSGLTDAFVEIVVRLTWHDGN